MSWLPAASQLGPDSASLHCKPAAWPEETSTDPTDPWPAPTNTDFLMVILLLVFTGQVCTNTETHTQCK